MPTPDAPTPNAYAPRCGHHGNPLVWLDPALRWRCPHCFPELFPAARPAAGSSSPDVTDSVAEQMGLADDPFFAREYHTNVYVHALMYLAEAQAARITELEAAIRKHRDEIARRSNPDTDPYRTDARLWALLEESPDG